MTNQSVVHLQSAIESVFQTKYARPVKEFNNVAFANGVIMNGFEARAEYEKKTSRCSSEKRSN